MIESFEVVSRNSLIGTLILTVDDNADSREITGFALEQAGAEVISVASGAEVLNVLSITSPNLLISDLGMPDMDGYSLMQRIRRLPKGRSLPAIALTAYACEAKSEQIAAAGFRCCLNKPVSPDDLITAVEKVLGKRR